MRALVVFALASVGFAGANIFYDSFLTDVTSRARMDRVSTAGFAWGYIGSTVPFVVAMALILAAQRLGISSVAAVRIAFAITAAWWAVFTVPLLRHVRQRFFQPAVAHVVGDAFRRLGRVFREIRGYKLVFQFLVAYFFYIDGVGTIIKLATAYGTDIGLEANTLLVVVLAVQIVAFPSALAFGRLAARTSARTMLLFGIAVYVVVTLTAFAIPRLPQASRVPLFWAVAMLAATSQGGIQALSRSLFARLIPPASAAEFFGFYNVFGKFAAILGPVLVGGVAQLTGDTSLGVLGIIVLFTIGGGLLLRLPAGAGAATPPSSDAAAADA